ncbi:MAG TPA: universal stress protein [Frankiaceae bacterium]|jgi:nucleotide-binding universal stress UspA family protein|nr:universal stress protein [Frankiaceae bacterium]
MNDSVERPFFVAGIDGSEAGYAAASWAAARAARDGARVILVHAYQVPAVVSVAGPMRTPAQKRAARRTALRMLELAAKRLPPTVSVELIAEEGAADRVLVERAAAADLLVLGARPQHRHPHLRFIGSIASRCLRQAECPVVLVPSLAAAPAVGDQLREVAAQSA